MCSLAFWKICFIPEGLCLCFQPQIGDGMGSSLVLDTAAHGKVSLFHPFLLSPPPAGDAAGERHENRMSSLLLNCLGSLKNPIIKRSHRRFHSAGSPHRRAMPGLEPAGRRCQWQKFGWLFWCAKCKCANLIPLPRSPCACGSLLRWGPRCGGPRPTLRSHCYGKGPLH